MDTKLLRQKILDLAIRGKLVPQDPNDEPASVLLERIKAEKEQLIKDGKIKRPKKGATTSDSRHYPFELPNGWVWCRLVDITSVVGDGLHGTPQYNPNGAYYFVNGNNLSNRKILIKDSTKRVSKEEYIKYKKPLNEHTILVSINGTIGNVATYSNEKIILGKSACYFNITPFLVKEYMCYVIESNYFQKYALLSATGSTIKNVPLKAINEFNVPIPPVSEQKRIVSQIDYLLDFIYKVESEKLKLQDTIKQVKRKILDLAIHGKLVPQDPADEPASELLKRVNPNAEITSDNEHYPQLPNNWVLCKLEDIVDYEQPTLYIVTSTEYKDTFATPVLTAGKSFIIGRTNETKGVFSNLPCIIFDDFTTDSKYVDFPFKVKSSAMKILKVKDEILPKYVAMFMSITRLVGKTHKRYWISEYSKIQIPIPPKEEQKRIISAVEKLNNLLCNITESL